ncbi:hypothetical protein BC830DRAFT_1105870 [Chytriomyces sp. MP71]|nr:hypothetical protein BC830DRAFT_1105870 [Chytriomyces sp. MP71]
MGNTLSNPNVNGGSSDSHAVPKKPVIDLIIDSDIIEFLMPEMDHNNKKSDTSDHCWVILLNGKRVWSLKDVHAIDFSDMRVKIIDSVKNGIIDSVKYGSEWKDPNKAFTENNRELLKVLKSGNFLFMQKNNWLDQTPIGVKYEKLANLIPLSRSKKAKEIYLVEAEATWEFNYEDGFEQKKITLPLALADTVSDVIKYLTKELDHIKADYPHPVYNMWIKIKDLTVEEVLQKIGGDTKCLHFDLRMDNDKFRLSCSEINAGWSSHEDELNSLPIQVFKEATKKKEKQLALAAENGINKCLEYFEEITSNAEKLQKGLSTFNFGALLPVLKGLDFISNIASTIPFVSNACDVLKTFAQFIQTLERNDRKIKSLKQHANVLNRVIDIKIKTYFGDDSRWIVTDETCLACYSMTLKEAVEVLTEVVNMILLEERKGILNKMINVKKSEDWIDHDNSLTEVMGSLQSLDPIHLAFDFNLIVNHFKSADAKKFWRKFNFKNVVVADEAFLDKLLEYAEVENDLLLKRRILASIDSNMDGFIDSLEFGRFIGTGTIKAKLKPLLAAKDAAKQNFFKSEWQKSLNGPANCTADLIRLLDDYIPNTRDFLVERHLKSKSKITILRASAGFGKSVIAALFIQRLSRAHNSCSTYHKDFLTYDQLTLHSQEMHPLAETNVPPAFSRAPHCFYFFFVHDEPRKRTAENLIVTIAWQLYQILSGKNDNAQARKLMREIERHLKVPNFEELLDAVERIFKNLTDAGRYWIVLDACDECNSLEKVKSLIIRLNCIPNIQFQFLLTLRNDAKWNGFVDGLQGLHTDECVVEDVQNDTSKMAIQIYLESMLPHLSERGCDLLLEKSRGNFLWSKLAVNILRDSDSTVDTKFLVHTVLKDNLASQYEVSFGVALKQSVRQQELKILLSIILCAKEALKISDLEAIWAWHWQTAEVLKPKVGLSQLLTFLLSRLMVRKTGDDRIIAGHKSLRDSIDGMILSKVFDVMSGHSILARFSIRLLSKTCDSDFVKLRNSETPYQAIAEYAANNWYSHFNFFIGDDNIKTDYNDRTELEYDMNLLASKILILSDKDKPSIWNGERGVFWAVMKCSPHEELCQLLKTDHQTVNENIHPLASFTDSETLEKYRLLSGLFKTFDQEAVKQIIDCLPQVPRHLNAVDLAGDNNYQYHIFLTQGGAEMKLAIKCLTLLSESGPFPVQYAIQKWTQHFCAIPFTRFQNEFDSMSMATSLTTFCKSNLLRWIEMSYRLGLEHAAILMQLKSVIQMTARVIVKCDNPESKLELGYADKILSDSMRMLIDFKEAIDCNPSHLYKSAIVWCPQETEIYKTYHHPEHSIARISVNIPSHWTPRRELIPKDWRDSEKKQEPKLKCFAISENRILVADDSSTTSLFMWDVTTQTQVTWAPWSENYCMKIPGVTALAISPNENWFFVGQENGDITVFSREINVFGKKNNGNFYRTILKAEIGKNTTSEITSFAVTFDNKRLISASGDGVIRVWSLTDRDMPVLQKKAYCCRSILKLIVTEDNSIISMCKKAVFKWDLYSTEPVLRLADDGESSLKTVAFSKCHRKLICGRNDGSLQLITVDVDIFEGIYGCDLSKAQEKGLTIFTLMGPGGDLATSVAIFADGSKAVSVHHEQVQIWELGEKPSPLFKYACGSLLLGAELSVDERFIFTLGEANVFMYSATEVSPQKWTCSKLKREAKAHNVVKLQPRADPDVSLPCVDENPTMHGDSTHAVALSLDKRIVASGCHKGKIVLWWDNDVHYVLREEGTKELERPPVELLQFANDASRLVSVLADNSLIVWELDQFEEQCCVTEVFATDSVLEMCGSSFDGKKMAVGSVCNVTVVDIDCRRKFQWVVKQSVKTIEISGDYVAIASTNCLEIWNWATQTLIKTFDLMDVVNLYFSNEGAIVRAVTSKGKSFECEWLLSDSVMELVDSDGYWVDNRWIMKGEEKVSFACDGPTPGAPLIQGNTLVFKPDNLVIRWDLTESMDQARN